MKNKWILFAIFIMYGFTGFAQQIPLNTCGLVHIYDASGNRTKRIYFCNNGGAYPTKIQNPASFKSESKDSLHNGLAAIKDISQNMEFQVIDALYPNPTTGKFSITFSKALNNAKVFITDGHGKTINHFRSSGNKVDFDLSKYAAGVYFIRVDDAGNIINKKVVKQ